MPNLNLLLIAGGLLVKKQKVWSFITRQMKREKINHIIHQQYRNIEKYCNNIIPDYDIETIHQFRIAYKRLRAFLRMIAEGEGQASGTGISGDLRTGYHLSGTIRDLQLQQQRVREATKYEVIKPKVYLGLLQKEINKLKPGLSGIVSGNPVANSRKKTDASIPHTFPESSFRQFVQKKRDDVYEMITAGHFSDTTIHAIRKKLKDLFYNFEIYGGVGQNILSQGIWEGKDEGHFTGLLDELGRFQDQCIAIALIKPRCLNSLPRNNHTQMERIKKIWIKDKLYMKRLLVKKLGTDLIPK